MTDMSTYWTIALGVFLAVLYPVLLGLVRKAFPPTGAPGLPPWVTKYGLLLIFSLVTAFLEAFFARAAERGELAFLLDGLDQIPSGKPSDLVKLAFEIAGRSSVILTSRPSAVSGRITLGWSFSGPDVIASASIPSLPSRPDTSPVSSSTPIEPVRVPSRAKMRAAGTATM